MRSLGFHLLAVLVLATAVRPACCGGAAPGATQAGAGVVLGIGTAALSPVIDNPYVSFAVIQRAVFEGEEPDDERGGKVHVRTECTVRQSPETVAGVQVTVVEVADFEAGELVEKTLDYYAQDSTGVVYYIGEKVDDIERGKVVGHGGQWLAGRKGARAGVFMPAAPQVGDAFEQERAPGVAQDRSKVVATHSSVTVPAGTFADCIELEDFDPIGKTTQRKICCRGVGLVREIFPGGISVDLFQVD
jgi:hypothetical protein